MQQSDFGVKDYGDLSLHRAAQIMSRARGMKCSEGEEVMHMSQKSLGNVFFIIQKPTAKIKEALIIDGTVIFIYYFILLGLLGCKTMKHRRKFYACALLQLADY